MKAFKLSISHNARLKENNHFKFIKFLFTLRQALKDGLNQFCTLGITEQEENIS